MKEFKKLQNKIKTEFETPEVPFDEWANQHNISDGVEFGSTDYLRFEEVENGNVRYKTRNRALIIGGSAVALLLVLFLTLYFVLPLLLGPKMYGANDVVSNRITMEEVTSVEDIYLFDTSVLAKTESVTKDVLIKDNSQALLYSINNNLLSVENGEGYDAFYLTYKIRTYPNYVFFEYNNYLKIDKSIQVGNLEIGYVLVNIEVPYAYASFKHNNYDYYIEAHGFENVTVLNEDNFINLLNEILI